MLQVEKGKVVTLSYTLRENNAQGTVLEVMDEIYPFKFYFGTGQLLPAFEEAIVGLPEGGAFEFLLSPAQAYGEVESGNIVDVPIDVFKVDGRLPDGLVEIGQYVALTDDLGQTHNGKILIATDDFVKVDFNHIMAGKTLHFKGVVLHIREATPEEQQRQSYVEAGGVRR